MTTEKKQRRVLVTAGLPYSNGNIHAGHLAGAYIPSDIFVRYLRLTGAEVRFICGSDDHGVAIMLSAEKEGKTPSEVASFYRASQAADFKAMQIDFDIYSGTSSNPYHAKASQDFFSVLYDKGFFSKESSRQFYDESRSEFLPDRYVKGDCGFCGALEQNGDQCEQCGKIFDTDSLKNPVSVLSGNHATVRDTVHWFLDLARFRPVVEEWLGKAEIKEQTKAFAQGLINSGLVKRAMTRDLSWGIPLPIPDKEAEGKVLYVWFDAPIGYISNTVELLARSSSNSTIDDWWRSPDTDIFHFIGEDNTIFHCVIWIAMLSAEGSYQLPKGVIVNQFLGYQRSGGEVEKMSKSRGTAVWINELLSSGVSSDTVRYYLTAIAPERSKSGYNPDDLKSRHNSELADTLGNLVNRVTSFALKNVGDTVPAPSLELSERDTEFLARLDATFASATQHLESYGFKAALEVIIEFARECNRFVDEKAPWKTKKTDQAATVHTIALLLKGIHALGVMLAPFIPTTSRKILEAFSRNEADLKWSDALQFEIAGRPLKQPEILFHKFEAEPKT